MVLYTEVEEVIKEIESGKRSLFDTIKEFMVKIEEMEKLKDLEIEKVEEKYGNEIEYLDNEISDLEETIEDQDDKIEKLEKIIENKNKEIEKLKNEINNLNTMVNI